MPPGSTYALAAVRIGLSRRLASHGGYYIANLTPSPDDVTLGPQTTKAETQKFHFGSGRRCGIWSAWRSYVQFRYNSFLSFGATMTSLRTVRPWGWVSATVEPGIGFSHLYQGGSRRPALSIFKKNQSHAMCLALNVVHEGPTYGPSTTFSWDS